MPFQPRAWQVPLINDPAKRITAVVHRRAGKSTGLLWRGIGRALTIPRTNPLVNCSYMAVSTVCETALC